MTPFLPNNYKSPKTSGYYMKFQEGENRIRVLSRPILGWEDWHEKVPVRYQFDDKPAVSYDPKRPVRHFWSMIVWNYGESQIQIMHVTQASVRNAIEALNNDSDWGAPYFYDIKIHKKGEGKDTEYTVMAVSPKALAPAIKEAFHNRRCRLEALFDNQDPFMPGQDYTEGVFTKEDLEAASFSSPFDELKEFLIVEGCNAEHLQGYLDVQSKKKGQTIEKMAEYALTILDSFKEAYEKYLSTNSLLEPVHTT